ncbi:hypothetical protein PENTCL1PPCAC_19850 [Pristionchus entomophagus]|uniref:Protein kinase domain-containing protein n=1 Tax=Pristionchus entomophagus TaxID=358040 RepID=A0AAV5TT74_9BILA|nr:hypothetical protein PENTCL1PPCAC_19850 [Pristionchus entomophagus]
MPADAKVEEGPVEIAKGTVIGKKWKILRKLGEGGCGAVYLVEQTETKRQAALKAESNFVEGGSVLKIEVDILGRLKGRKHVAELIHSGKKAKFQYMVMSLLGESLNNLLKKAGKQCSMSTQLRVGIHVLHGLKQVHDAGFIHRDIKPANLAMGNRNGGTDPAIVHILDFGLSREYIIKDDTDNGYKMRKPRKRALFRGTIRYCSVSTHEKNEQGRPDDLWSLLYVMVELRGKLPWSHLKEKKDLAEAKRAMPDSKLLVNSPQQLTQFADHLRSLDYWTRPDYMLLYKCLLDAMNDGGYRFSDQWGWEEKSIASKISSILGDDNLVKTQVDEEETGKMQGNPFTDEDFSSNPLGF